VKEACHALEQKIEAVKKVGEALNKQQPQVHEELERVAPNKEHFQNFLNTSSTIQPSFQRLDGSVVAPEQAHSVENPFLEMKMSLYKEMEQQQIKKTKRKAASK